MMIVPGDTTGGADSLNAGVCTAGDQGHCGFIAFSSEQLDWIIDAADLAQCGSMQGWMQQGVLHGWIHKVALPQPRYPYEVLQGDDHFPAGTAGDPRARVHMDANYGLTSRETATFVFYHEVAHIFHPELSDGSAASEKALDDIATTCMN